MSIKTESSSEAQELFNWLFDNLDKQELKKFFFVYFSKVIQLKGLIKY